ncbi:hypothetical protein GGR95_000833 [Sulfitobacter undariae]|uniref:Cytochrome c oxidase subunit IV bacterial aa3 type domain-containing protein n=1 Tax=Sulfitobacter undariae TaxID=1563671 RepID=A0A7W6E1Y4_9RHOB|nr:aa3-type cytochrome c oxidase subunit IV [Sulfitobacter undariae]MBB3993205.1 hypothetical protein [Sulfitobacter undariae]
MAEHEHGSMNSEENQKMFDAFITFVTRSSIAIIGVLIFMAIFAR